MAIVEKFQKVSAVGTERRWPLGVAAVVLILLAVLVSKAFYTVEEGHVGIVKRFGQAVEPVGSGLHMKIPLVDVVELIEVRTKKNAEKLSAATREQMPVTAEVSINWTIVREQAFELFKQYGGVEQFEARILDPKLRSATKDGIAKFTAEELIQNRSAVMSRIEALLGEEMKMYPVKLDSAQLENIELPQKYIQSIETKQTEKNLTEAERFRLDRQNLEAQRQVNTAHAERDAAKARADGEAYATRTSAEAEAQAIRMKGAAEAESMTKKALAIRSSGALVEYERALRWNGQLPSTMMGAGTNVLWNLGSPQARRDE